MTETIDGSQKIEDQESAIQFKEAKGYNLKSIAADKANAPMNLAEFDQLQIGVRPKRIHLTLPPMPTGKTPVCTGNIYVESKPADVVAYRD